MTFKMPGMVSSIKKNVNENYLEQPESLQIKAIYDKDKAIIESKRMRQEHIAAMEKWEKERDREDQTRNMFSNQYSNQLKLGVIESVGKQIADRVLSESFAQIYIKSLPLDTEFVTENTEHLKDFAYMYIRKLGGMDYFKKRVMEVHTPFLDKLYTACTEQAKKMTKKRSKKVIAQNSSDLLHEITDCKCTDDEQNQILKNVDQLGADQLAELVKQKIINVVKDEKMKEVDERESRTVLKNDLLDTSPSHPVDNETSDPMEPAKNASGLPKTGDELDDMSKDDLKSTPDSSAKPDKTIKSKPGGSGFDPAKIQKKEKQDMMNKEENKIDKKAKKIEQNAEVDKMNTETKDKKKETNKSKMANESWVSDKLSFTQIVESYNPVNGSLDSAKFGDNRSLFFSMMVSILRSQYPEKAITESTDKFRSKNRYNVVMENPLNLDVFATYLQNGDDSINTLETSPISEPNIIGSSDDHVDNAAILTEAIIQYGLFETAYTMKLIDVTPAIVKEQTEYLLKTM